MTYQETRTVVFARSAVDLSERRFIVHDGDVFGPEVEGYGQIEIVQSTTVKKFRSNGTALPGAQDERTETVLARLSTGAATHLMRTLAESLADALDSRGTSAVTRSAATVTTEEI